MEEDSISRTFYSQFESDITNVHIFSNDQNKNIQQLSSNPCTWNGTYLSWKEMEFDLEGNASITYIHKESLCSQTDQDLFPIPGTYYFNDTYQSCNLMKGRISGLETFQKWEFVSKSPLIEDEECTYFWTPYTGNNSRYIHLMAINYVR